MTPATEIAPYRALWRAVLGHCTEAALADMRWHEIVQADTETLKNPLDSHHAFGNAPPVPASWLRGSGFRDVAGLAGFDGQTLAGELRRRIAVEGAAAVLSRLRGAA